MEGHLICFHLETVLLPKQEKKNFFRLRLMCTRFGSKQKWHNGISTLQIGMAGVNVRPRQGASGPSAVCAWREPRGSLSHSPRYESA